MTDRELLLLCVSAARFDSAIDDAEEARAVALVEKVLPEPCPERLGPIACVQRGKHTNHKASDGGTWNEHGMGQLSLAIVQAWPQLKRLGVVA